MNTYISELEARQRGSSSAARKPICRRTTRSLVACWVQGRPTTVTVSRKKHNGVGRTGRSRPGSLLHCGPCGTREIIRCEGATAWVQVSPERARAWIRVARDGLLILFGTATFATVLVLYIVRGEPPNLTLIGFATAAFGLGVVLRADELVVRGGNGNGNGGKSDRGA